jgi:hypothetical protein
VIQEVPPVRLSFALQAKWSISGFGALTETIEFAHAHGIFVILVGPDIEFNQGPPSLYRDLCTPACPLYAAPDVPLLFDSHHFTAAGATLLANAIFVHHQLPWWLRRIITVDV